MRIKRGFQILCGILLIPLFYFSEVNAQEINSRWFKPQFVFKTWDNKSGLPQNTVYDLSQDGEGYLWIATEEGLLRFDGNTFKIINEENTQHLYSSTFYDLCESSQKGTWAASGNTVLFLYHNEIKAFDFRQHLHGSRITRITEDKNGILWVGTNSGEMFYLERGSIKKLTSWGKKVSKSINVFQRVSDGILIGTTRGLFKIKNNSHDIIRIDGYDSLNVRALAEDKDESIWIGTEEDGVFHKTINKTVHFTEKEGLREAFITSVGIAPNGNVWIGTSGSGVQIYKNGTFSDLGQKTPNYGVKSILFTDDNLTWLGTTGSGLIQVKPAEIQMLSDNFGLSENIILPIYQHSNGDIWIGSAGNGISKISNGKTIKYTRENGLGSNFILSIYGTDDAVFIGTTKGLNRYNLQTGKIDRSYTVKDGLANNVIQAILYDSQHSLWISTRSGGIHKFEDDGKLKTFKVPSAFSNAGFISIFEDHNKNMWFGSNGSGLLRISPKEEVTHYSIKEGLPSGIINNFYEDEDGEVWMGTEKGLVCYINNRFITFNNSNGFAFKGIYQITDDGSGYLWLSGNFGLQRISADALNNLKKHRGKVLQIPTKFFDASDGMANSELNGGIFPAGWKMKDGSLWFPTIKGVAIIQPGLINDKASAVNIHIETMRFGNEQRSLSGNSVVPAGVYNIEIDYTSINFTKPNNINYYYRLKGLGNKWEAVGNRRTAYFTSLEPGRYTFEVKAEQYGKWSETATLEFDVKPFFYQTTWFKALLLILLFIAGVFAKQFYSKFQEETKLKALVEDRTRELQLSNQRLKIVNKAIEEQNQKLKEIAWTQSHLVRAPLANMLGIINLLEDCDHSNSDFDELISNIKKSGHELDKVIKDIAKKSATVKSGVNEDAGES